MDIDTRTIEFAQPNEVKSKVVEKMNAKGDLQPEIELSIMRRLEKSEDVFKTIDNDLQHLIEKATNGLKALKKLDSTSNSNGDMPFN